MTCVLVTISPKSANLRNVMDELPNTDSIEAVRLCADAYALLEERQFTRAHALLERARALAPDNPRIHYNLGLLFSDTGRTGDALAARLLSFLLQGKAFPQAVNRAVKSTVADLKRSLSVGRPPLWGPEGPLVP